MSMNSYGHAQYLLYEAKICRFIEIRYACEAAYAVGDWLKLAFLLDLTEKELGVSLWLTEMRSAYLQSNMGKEERRSYLASIVNSTSENPYIQYMFLLFNYRAEENVSARDFVSTLHNVCPPESAASKIVHLAMGFCPQMTFDEAAQCLSRLGEFPIIDQYNLVLAITQCLFASLSEKEEHENTVRAKNAYTSAAELIDQFTGDRQVRRLHALVGKVDRISDGDTLIDMLDQYSTARYDTLTLANKDCIEKFASIDGVNILARADVQNLSSGTSCAQVFFSGKLNRLYEQLKEIATFSSLALNSTNQLEKEAQALGGSTWAAGVRLILDRQTNDERIFKASRRQVFSALRCYDENPILSFIFDAIGSGERYLSAISSGLDQSETITITRTLLRASVDGSSLNGGLPDERCVKIEAINYLRAANPQAAVTRLEKANKERRSELSYFESGILLIEAYLRSANLHACSDLCAKLYVERNNLAPLLPLERLISGLLEAYENAPNIDATILGRLSVVISLDMYSRFVSPSHDSERADSFNDFLQAQRVSKISEINVNGFQDDIDELIYFLTKVCVTDVLDQSLALSSTRSVEDERAIILVIASDLLASLGHVPPPELEEELRDIRTRQVVRETTLQLDQSKIFVNVDGIKKSINLSLKEQWNRYRLVSSQHAPSAFEEFQKVIRQAVGDKVVLLPLSAPLSEKGNLFARMVLDVRDQFTTSREYGLDSNLSTNLRHGDVLRELRGPFLQHRLVTNKQTDMSEYQDNSHWIISDDFGQISRLQTALANFSAAIDNEIERLNREVIRIRSEQAPSGLFNYTVTEPEIHYLQSMCDTLESHEEFLEVVIQRLWTYTGTALTDIQRELNTVTSTTFQSALDSLQATAVEIDHYDELSSLVSAINLARPDMQAAIDRVSGWFRLSRNYEFQDYALVIAFEAALATVRTYFSNINIQFRLAGPDQTVMAGWTLPYFVRLLSLLFQNAAQHCGIEHGRLRLNCSIVLANETIRLDVENDFSPTKDVDALRSKVASLNADFGAEGVSERVVVEGGSGYPKIWKILAHDLRRDYRLEVKLRDDEIFCVSIDVNSRDLVR